MEALRLSAEQAYRLKHTHADTHEGRRDALLMGLLLDQGLQVAEIISFNVQDVDPKTAFSTYTTSKRTRTNFNPSPKIRRRH
jgi:site-specific recombinase XerD